MSVHDYVKFDREIRDQQDLLMATAAYYRLCQVFVQDCWIDHFVDIKNKATIMFELQAHFRK